MAELQAGDGKPVTDQWLPPFVVTGEDGKPVGTIEVSSSSSTAVTRCYRFGFKPCVIEGHCNRCCVCCLQDGDAVVLFNFRADRMVEISKAFEYEDFNAFDRKRFPKAGFFIPTGVPDAFHLTLRIFFGTPLLAWCQCDSALQP